MCHLSPEMQFVTILTRIQFYNNLFTQKTHKLQHATFSDQTAKLYYHIIDIHTQGFIILNKYKIGIASIGLPKVDMLATKYVTKRL